MCSNNNMLIESRSVLDPVLCHARNISAVGTDITTTWARNMPSLCGINSSA